jgi:hypothetical protein
MVVYDNWEQQHDYERAWEEPEDAESRRERMKKWIDPRLPSFPFYMLFIGYLWLIGDELDLVSFMWDVSFHAGQRAFGVLSALDVRLNSLRFHLT